MAKFITVFMRDEPGIINLDHVKLAHKVGDQMTRLVFGDKKYIDIDGGIEGFYRKCCEPSTEVRHEAEA